MSEKHIVRLLVEYEVRASGTNIEMTAIAMAAGALKGDESITRLVTIPGLGKAKFKSAEVIERK